MPEPLEAGIRAELDQTPAWRERQFSAHEDHKIVEHRTYCSTTVRRRCFDCGIEIDPYEEGP